MIETSPTTTTKLEEKSVKSIERQLRLVHQTGSCKSRTMMNGKQSFVHAEIMLFILILPVALSLAFQIGSTSK